MVKGLRIFKSLLDKSSEDREDFLDAFHNYLFDYFSLKIGEEDLLKYLYDEGLMILFYISDLFIEEDFKNSDLSKNASLAIIQFKKEFFEHRKKVIVTEYKQKINIIFEKFYESFLENSNLFFLQRQIEIAQDSIEKLIFEQMKEKLLIQERKKSVKKLFSWIK